MKNFLTTVILATVMLAAAISLNVWLDSGCDLNGVLTWHGRECIDATPTHYYADGSYRTINGQVGCAYPAMGCAPDLD